MRLEQIRAKLTYATSRYQELREKLSKVEAENASLDQLGFYVEDILAACRECFDYALKDAVNFHGLDKRLKRTKLYFPFSQEAPQSPGLGMLRSSSGGFFPVLESLTRKIAEQQMIPNLMTDYGILSTINKLVNRKKHESILSFHEIPDSQTEFSAAGASMRLRGPMVYDPSRHTFWAQDGAMELVTSEGAKTRLIKQFVIAENGAEISAFCQNAINATERVIAEFYDLAAGGQGNKAFRNYSEENERKQEALSKIYPALSKPILIALRDGKRPLVTFRYDMAGTVTEANYEHPRYGAVEDSQIPSLLYRLIEQSILPTAMAQLRREVEEKLWRNIKTFDPAILRVCECHCSGLGTFKVFSKGQFVLGPISDIIVGIGTHFQTQPSLLAPSSSTVLLNRLWKLLTHGINCNLNICGQKPDGEPIFEFFQERDLEEKTYWAVGPIIDLTKGK